MIGRQLSHFRILDRIGEGGMTVVAPKVLPRRRHCSARTFPNARCPPSETMNP